MPLIGNFFALNAAKKIYHNTRSYARDLVGALKGLSNISDGYRYDYSNGNQNFGYRGVGYVTAYFVSTKGYTDPDVCKYNMVC